MNEADLLELALTKFPQFRPMNNAEKVQFLKNNPQLCDFDEDTLSYMIHYLSCRKMGEA